MGDSIQFSPTAGKRRKSYVGMNLDTTVGYAESYAALTKAANPLAYYRFHDLTTLRDEMGNYHGTVTNPVSQTGALKGDRDKGFSCPTGSANLNSFVLPSGTDISVEFWTLQTAATITATAAFMCGSVAGNGVANRCLCHCPWEDGTIYFDFGDVNQLGLSRIFGTFGPYLNKWSHVVCVAKNNGTFQGIYIDGQLRYFRTSHLALAGPLTGVMLLDFPGASKSQASMDELAFYTRELTATEIAAKYALGLNGISLSHREVSLPTPLTTAYVRCMLNTDALNNETTFLRGVDVNGVTQFSLTVNPANRQVTLTHKHAGTLTTPTLNTGWNSVEVLVSPTTISLYRNGLGPTSLTGSYSFSVSKVLVGQIERREATGGGQLKLDEVAVSASRIGESL